MSNGQPVAVDGLADRWDADSVLSFTVSVSVPNSKIESLNDGGPVLNLSIGCKETGESTYSRAQFSKDSSKAYATATVILNGSAVAEQLELRATVTAPFGNSAWLSRRIIASRPVEKINLDSHLVGFPTSAVSFKANNLAPAPWVVRINAVSLSDPCANSIRLLLNEDYPRVVELIEGRARPYVEEALQVTIIRSLLSTAQRLSSIEGGISVVADVIAEYPDSIAAAAEKSCRDYLNKSLPAALTLLEREPETVEHLITSAVGFLKGR
ncbi:hypothetical protein PGC08_01615 [Brevibacterium sp. BDJS002]|uniref:hypothetical protein n=1 Tax=Brevibacterium sp. BDJS002 TaxID=3020906 RepID=UPI002307E11A|nr:hypothetical protein [Brevibacterium sp. BDJS002]WCE40423.1 hypothetical protein PGC08_01615 [Brevibacterium sp. BDJS002]